MKSIGYILIVALAVHSLCGVRCLGTDFVPSSPASESDCHHPAGNAPENSSKTPAPDHSNSACASAQALDGRSDFSRLLPCHQALADLTPLVSKQLSLPSAADVILQIDESFSPPGMILVLRI
jgi:hypothetical protein